MATNNMVNPAVNPDEEDALFAKEVEQVKAWWSDPRWRYTKRPFTPEQIVSKRGHLQVDYPSNAQAKKLWGILENRFKVSCALVIRFGVGDRKAQSVLIRNRPRMPATRTAAWSPRP